MLSLDPNGSSQQTINGTFDLTYLNRGGFSHHTTASISFVGTTLSDRGTWWEQRTVGKTTALALLVEGMKKAGRVLTRETLVDALDRAGTIDLSGFKVTYSPTNHVGTDFVELTVLGSNGTYKR